MNPKARPTRTIACGFCEKPFEIDDSDYKTRMKLSRSGKLFCSMRCFGDFLKDPMPQIVPTKIVYSKDFDVEQNSSWIEHKTDETKWEAVLLNIRKIDEAG